MSIILNGKVIAGASTGGTGPFVFHIDSNGHLIMDYEGTTAPGAAINSSGHLILDVNGQTIDCGEVTNSSDLTSISAAGTTNATGSTISSGMYFYLNGVLVKAKTDIASGATFTENTNYEVVTAGGLNDLKSALNSMVQQLPIRQLNISISNNVATIDTGIWCVPWRADAGIIVLRGRDVWSNPINAVYYISANYDSTVTGPPTLTKIVGDNFTISVSVVDLEARLTITMSQAINDISATLIQ